MTQQKTIAQTLRAVKTVKGKMAELSARAQSVARWEEGKEPAFKYGDVEKALAETREELIRLESGIARANALTAIEHGGRKMWLAEAVRRLQELKGELARVERLPAGNKEEIREDYEYDEATGRNVRRRVVTKFVSVLEEPTKVALVEKLRAEFQELNDVVESTNHRTEVPLDSPQ